jgi:hypothetical protein
MRMPGFTAEASLYDGPGQYRMEGVAEGSAAGAQVVPQACVNIGPCRVCVNVRIFPPRACLSFSCLGFNRSFCVP